MASIYEKCRICKHSKFDKSCGLVCTLTNSKPAVDKDCQDFLTDQKAIDVNVYRKAGRSINKKALWGTLITILLIGGIRVGIRVTVKEQRRALVHTKRLGNSGFVTLATPSDRFGHRIDDLIEACEKEDIDGVAAFGRWYNALSDEDQEQVKEVAKKEYDNNNMY